MSSKQRRRRPTSCSVSISSTNPSRTSSYYVDYDQSRSMDRDPDHSRGGIAGRRRMQREARAARSAEPGPGGSERRRQRAAAYALKVGAIGKVTSVVDCGGNSECLWEEIGNLTDEYHNADFQNTRQDIDQRSMGDDNPLESVHERHATTWLRARRHRRREAVHPRQHRRHRRDVHGAGLPRDVAGRELLQRHSAGPHGRRRFHLRAWLERRGRAR